MRQIFYPLLAAASLFLCACPSAKRTGDDTLSSKTVLNDRFDPDFLGACLSELDINKNLTYGDIVNVTELDVSNMGLTSIKGIEYFTSLEELNCSGNGLKALDVSKNLKLYWLECQDNLLASLDVSILDLLEVLDCSDNLLEELDVTRNSKLDGLYCDDNKLKNLDVVSNPALVYFTCDNNLLTGLDISNNRLLKRVSCEDNPIKDLRVWKGFDKNGLEPRCELPQGINIIEK